MWDEHDHEDTRYLSVYRGTVVDNADPEGGSRVKVSVDGLVEPAAWAYPLDGQGGGAPQTGSHHVPPVGAEVAVWFEQGDPNYPLYKTLNHGEGEELTPLKEAGSAKEKAEIRAWEYGNFLLVFDCREGKDNLYIKHKTTDDTIEIDGAGQGIRLKATTALVLEADGVVEIRGSQVVINGERLGVSR